MNVTELIRKAGRRFGDTNERLITAQDFYDFINDGQLQITRLTGDIKTSDTAAANTYPVTLSATFIRGEQLTYGGRPLDITDKDALNSLYIDPTLNQDKPYFYYYFDNKVHLYPDPVASDSTSVVFTYFSTPTQVTSAATALTVPIAQHEDLVTFVVARCHERNENWNMYGRLMDEFNSNLGTRLEEAKVKDDTYPIIRDDDYWVS